MHPIAFQIGSLAVPWHGLILLSACVIGLWNACEIAPKEGICRSTILNACPWLIAGGIIGARVLYVVTHWQQEFAGQPALRSLIFWEGGGGGYGGLMGGFVAGTYYLLLKRVPYWKAADIFSSSVPLGYAILRLGCLMHGCCYGAPSDLPWAVSYPEGHVTHSRGFTAVPVHPTQLYDSALNFGLFMALRWFYPRKKFDGQVFCLFLMCYAPLRSLMDVFRGDHPPAESLNGWYTSTHLLGFFAYISACVLAVMLKRSASRSAPTAE